MHISAAAKAKLLDRAFLMLIQASNMVSGYGGEPILNGVDIALESGRIGVIVGPNGAGKSTVLKSLFGLIKLDRGAVAFEGKDISGIPPDQRVAMGMGYVPQEMNIFPSLTVRENLDMGAFIRSDDYSSVIEQVVELFPPLQDKMQDEAGKLSGGQRQMVAIGRALMVEPRLLLLDEPTVGLSPAFVQDIVERVVAIASTGVGILVVEQNARRALEIADFGFVLAGGRNLYTDTGRNLLNNPEVAKSFLGM